jgi:hypothetical protein
MLHLCCRVIKLTKRSQRTVGVKNGTQRCRAEHQYLERRQGDQQYPVHLSVDLRSLNPAQFMFTFPRTKLIAEVRLIMKCHLLLL